MGVSIRVFIEGPTGHLQPMPRARWERVWHCGEPLPELAGQRLRWAEVAVEVHGRHIVRALQITTSQLAVHLDGRVDTQAAMRQAVEHVGRYYRRLVAREPDVALTIADLESDANRVWLLPPEHLEMISAALKLPVARLREVVHPHTPLG